MRFVRRHLPQVLALAAVVLVAAGLGTVALRSATGPRTGGGTHPPVTAQSAATPDPRVDDVKAVARRFLVALWESAKSGDTTALHMLTVSGTQADGNAGLVASFGRDTHHTFAASRVEIDEGTWQIDVLSEHAAVRVMYHVYGHDADWPSLAPREMDHLTPAYSADMEMELLQSKWLIDKFS